MTRLYKNAIYEWDSGKYRIVHFEVSWWVAVANGVNTEFILSCVWR